MPNNDRSGCGKCGSGNYKMTSPLKYDLDICWLVRATYMVDGRFFGLFLEGEGTVRIHLSHLQLQYTYTMQDGGLGGAFQTLGYLESSNFFKGGREH